MNEVQKLLKLEQKRQSTYVELIASENFVSKEVLEMNGSIFTNKYAEGYPGRRYYGGCEIVDKMESLAIENAKKIFNCNFANVQPHSGSQANFAVYLGLLKPGDKILGMSLDAGGHLTHGHFVSSSGIFYKSVKYFVDKKTQQLDYEAIEKIALEEKPQLIIAGASAYSKEIDFSKFRKIADKVGALLMADIAHIAGLIVAGLHQSPMDYCDVVTTTTHKTLRGPRGGLILTNNEEIAKKINRAVFPGTQGGPLLNIIAAKAVAFEEASRPEFVTYQKNVLKNVQAMIRVAKKHNLSIVSGGSDNHLFMINTKESFNLSGQQAEDYLYKINVIVNKNSIPYDTEGPNVTSGIRIGTPAMTTKGFNENDFENLMQIIIETLLNPLEENFIKNKAKILKMVDKYE